MTAIADGSTFSPGSVAAAVFDIGGVFTYPDYRPVDAVLGELGIDRPSDATAYRRAHNAGARALTDALRASGATPDETDARFWSAYDRGYGESLGVGPDDVEQMAAAVRSGAWNWAHEANIAAFAEIAAMGLPVAIVSNNNGTAAEQLVAAGVCQVGPGSLPDVAALKRYLS